jgi:hypothetical protein
MGEAKILKTQDFTVPQYLEDWYWYGRLEYGCSCIITQALPSLLVSATTTNTVYNFTSVSFFPFLGTKSIHANSF